MGMLQFLSRPPTFFPKWIEDDLLDVQLDLLEHLGFDALNHSAKHALWLHGRLKLRLQKRYEQRNHGGIRRL